MVVHMLFLHYFFPVTTDMYLRRGTPFPCQHAFGLRQLAAQAAKHGAAGRQRRGVWRCTSFAVLLVLACCMLVPELSRSQAEAPAKDATADRRTGRIESARLPLPVGACVAVAEPLLVLPGPWIDRCLCPSLSAGGMATWLAAPRRRRLDWNGILQHKHVASFATSAPRHALDYVLTHVTDIGGTREEARCSLTPNSPLIQSPERRTHRPSSIGRIRAEDGRMEAWSTCAAVGTGFNRTTDVTCGSLIPARQRQLAPRRQAPPDLASRQARTHARKGRSPERHTLAERERERERRTGPSNPAGPGRPRTTRHGRLPACPRPLTLENLGKKFTFTPGQLPACSVPESTGHAWLERARGFSCGRVASALHVMHRMSAC
jgi:hypothetical protein